MHAHSNGTMPLSENDEEHPESDSIACRLAFHVGLEINLLDEPTTGSSVWMVSLDTTRERFQPY